MSQFPGANLDIEAIAQRMAEAFIAAIESRERARLESSGTNAESRDQAVEQIRNDVEDIRNHMERVVALLGSIEQGQQTAGGA